MSQIIIGIKHICPNGGAATMPIKVIAQKTSNKVAKSKNVHLVAIKKNNMKDKNKDLDRWVTKIRSPYERVFSRENKRVRYAGIAKNQFAEFMKAICFNLRRVTVITAPSFA